MFCNFTISQIPEHRLYNNHLQGSLTDGTQFDASYDRGQPFDFQLGAGQVIKGRLKIDLHLRMLNMFYLPTQGMLTDGTVFDASYDRGEPIQFELGIGRVIKGGFGQLACPTRRTGALSTTCGLPSHD